MVLMDDIGVTELVGFEMAHFASWYSVVPIVPCKTSGGFQFAPVILHLTRCR